MTAVDAGAAGVPARAPRLGNRLRRVWLTGTLVCTLGAFVAAIALAPAGSAAPGDALRWLLFVGSSTHVAATAWFFTLPEVRGHARRHPRRYVLAPAGLIVGGAVVAMLVPPRRFDVVLLAYFAWQFFHFQKQNLGMAALAGVSVGAGSVSVVERRALLAAGACGIAALVVHPQLLQLTLSVHVAYAFTVAKALFAVSVAVGVAALLRRNRDKRPWSYCAVYASALLFFVPVFIFSNPYAAVAGLVLAHGGQYLVIVGLVAAGAREDRSRAVSLGLLLNVALIGGFALNVASHLHDAPLAGRAIFGAYLGVVMAHFVIDAGLWRLRDEFPRSLLRSAVPYLLGGNRAARP